MERIHRLTPEGILGHSLKAFFERQGQETASIVFIPEGRSHFSFDIRLHDGAAFVARFEKDRKFVDGVRRDFSFNGPISLQREANLLNLVRSGGLPAPKVFGIHETEHGPFLLVEKMPGVHWSEFLERNGFSKDVYLRTMRFLGEDIAKIQKIEFESFGDVISENEIHPGNINNFAQRAKMFLELKLKRAEEDGVLDSQEQANVKNYFAKELEELSQQLSAEKPVLVFTDMHPMNFLVDPGGKPSGYFDLEFCQAAHKSLEFYGIRMFLFSYFRGVSKEAEAAFMEGFSSSGGKYDTEDSKNLRLERLLAVGHLLSAATSYFRVTDGVRDTWSESFKQIMFGAIREGSVDYESVGDVFRMKTLQPLFPS